MFDDLIQRLEAADGPSFELERAIWEAVTPLHWRHPEDLPPAYTCSIDAALALLPEGLAWWVRKMRDGYLAGVVRYEPYFPFSEVTAATPALALCIAAMRARASQAVAPEAEERR